MNLQRRSFALKELTRQRGDFSLGGGRLRRPLRAFLCQCPELVGLGDVIVVHPISQRAARICNVMIG
ncbi:hypothetical protein D3C85_1888610 [compost metagenome]